MHQAAAGPAGGKGRPSPLHPIRSELELLNDRFQGALQLLGAGPDLHERGHGVVKGAPKDAVGSRRSWKAKRTIRHLTADKWSWPGPCPRSSSRSAELPTPGCPAAI